MHSYNRYYDSSASPSFSPNYYPGSRDVYHPEDYDDFGFLKKKSEPVVYSTASPVYNHNPTVEIQDSKVLGADERSANNCRSPIMTSRPPSPDYLPSNPAIYRPSTPPIVPQVSDNLNLKESSEM